MAHESDLISGLPYDVAFRCLARVPFYCHGNLRLVCQSWRAALLSHEIFKVRCEVGASEEFLCVIPTNPRKVCQLYDPCKDHWLTLTLVPSQLTYLEYFGVASIAGKLFVLGGSKGKFFMGHQIFTSNEVWSYDLFCREWSRKANMLVPRANFACCSLDRKIVVVGGFTSSDQTISKAEIYDPNTDTWQPLPDLPHTHSTACYGLVICGKIHVLHKGLPRVQILEDSHQWSVGDFKWPLGLKAVVGEELYVLNAEGFILKHQQENNLFNRLVAPPLPFHASYFDNSEILFIMIGVSDNLYVIGPGKTYWWKENLGILGNVNVLSVNSNSPTWRNSKMLERNGIILNCALLKV